MSEIWIYLEAGENGLAPISRELITKAHELAAGLGGSVAGLALGPGQIDPGWWFIRVARRLGWVTVRHDTPHLLPRDPRDSRERRERTAA